MSNNVSVAITGDVRDLQTKMALARAELRAFNADTKSLADQVRIAGDAEKSALLPQLEAAAVGAARTQAEIGSLRREMDALAGGGGHGSIATATREFRALFDELSSGRTRNTPGTLAIIANRVFGIQAGALAAGVGVGALVAALGYLAFRAIESSAALDKMVESARFAGNLDISRVQLNDLIEQTARFGNMSDSSAREVVTAFAGMRNETTPLLRALSAEIGDYMQVTGEDAAKAAESLTRAFSDPLAEGQKFLEAIPKVTQAQLDAFDAAKKQGDANAAAAVMVGALDTALGRARATMDEHNASMFASIKNWGAYIAGANLGASADEVQTAILKEQNAEREKQVALIRQAVAELQSTRPAPDTTLQIGVKAAQEEDTTGTRIEKVRADIDKMNAALAVARQTGDQLNVARLERGLAAAGRDLEELVSGNQVAQFRTRLAEMEATWTGTHRAMLEQAVRLWQQETQAANLSAKERLEVEKGLADAKVTLHREVEQEEDRIRRSDADADLAISRLKIEAQKSALEQELQARQINAAQKLQQLRALTEQEYQLNLAALQDELKLLREQPVEYERVYNQIRVLKAKEVADLAALDRQAALDAKRQADSELALHKDLSREIMTAEDGLVRGIFSGRQTLTQSLLAMGQNFLEREIANDLKYLTMRLLFGREEEAADKSSATGGLLVHLFAETAKTSATVTGTAARTTAITAGAAEQQAVEASAAKSGIFKHAASAAAAVYDDVAQIPYVGWILAPPAAAAAFAAVAAFGDLIPSFDVGSSMIGSTGLAMVHQGEAIVPAASAAPWRDGDGQQPLQISFAIHTPDAGGMANLLKSQQQTLQGMITKAVRDGYRAA